MYLVTGSQADRPEKNKITLLQLKDLHKTYVAAGKTLKPFLRSAFLLIILLFMNRLR